MIIHTPMEKQKWNLIEKIIDDALDVPLKKRRKFIEKACKESPGMLDEAMKWAESIDIAEHEMFLEYPDNLVADDVLNVAHDKCNRKKRLISHYEILDVTGGGGMGVVYKAKRADGIFEQITAIKMIRFGLETEQNIRRFETERTILASLNHPNIARLLDGGITDEGVPYLVMEWIDGIPIHDYIKNKNPDLNTRLDLFEQICKAVMYAHANLIIHRDIKPSNILVTAEGTIKVLDFGIAKIMEENSEKESVTHTGNLMMTAEYAAPEQINSKRASTSSDIYSLGILLHEMLTGTKLRDFSGKSAVEISQLINDYKPAKPSSVHLNGNNIPEELDLICVKAMRLEPENRYGTVQEFMDDIWRFRQRLPVSAKRATMPYRIKKFAGRHKGAVLAGIFGIVTTFIFILALIHQQKLTAQERDAARLEAEKSAQISQFLIDLFQIADPALSMGEQPTAIEMLQYGIDRADELSTQPELHAEILSVAGDIFYSMREFDKAEEVYFKGYLTSLDLYETDHPMIYGFLSSLGHTARSKQEFDLAEQYYLDALAMREKKHGENHPEIACALNDLGLIAHYRFQYSDAEQYYRRALGLRTGYVEWESPCIATILNNMGRLKRDTGNYVAAVAYHREALNIRRLVLGDHHPDVAATLLPLGISLRHMGRYDEAIQAYQEAIEINTKIFGPQHVNIASILNSLGIVYWLKGDYKASEKTHEEALRIRKNHYGKRHSAVATSFDNLATAIRDNGDPVKSLDYYRKALILREELFDKHHPLVASTLKNMSISLQLMNKHEEAEEKLRKSYEIRRNSLPDGHWQIAEVKSLLGYTLAALGAYDEAEPLLNNGYRILLEIRGSDDWYTKRATERLSIFSNHFATGM